MSFKIYFTGRNKKDNWDRYSWAVTLNGVSFEYHIGIGHATKSTGFNKPLSLKNKKVIRDGDTYIHVPKLKHILHALALDAQSGLDTFEDFCSNFGYDTDSRKALEVYLACQDANIKLRKVFKSKNYLERINAWEL